MLWSVYRHISCFVRLGALIKSDETAWRHKWRHFGICFGTSQCALATTLLENRDGTPLCSDFLSVLFCIIYCLNRPKWSLWEPLVKSEAEKSPFLTAISRLKASERWEQSWGHGFPFKYMQIKPFFTLLQRGTFVLEADHSFRKKLNESRVCINLE